MAEEHDDRHRQQSEERNHRERGPHTEVEFASGENGVIIRPARSKEARFRFWLEKARGSATSGETTDGIMRLTRGED